MIKKIKNAQRSIQDVNEQHKEEAEMTNNLRSLQMTHAKLTMTELPSW